MKEYVLSSAGSRFTEIPRKIWGQHVEQAPQDISKTLSFMTKAHHLIRYFVVRELPRIGKPIPPELISEELNMSLSKTTEILDDLERNLFFLVRNEQGEISWAFPVTVDKTPHQLTFSTGETQPEQLMRLPHPSCKGDCEKNHFQLPSILYVRTAIIRSKLR